MNKKINFNVILNTTLALIGFNLLILFAMSIFRGAFFAAYAEPAELKGMALFIAKAFFLGVRFDLVVVSYANILVTLSLLAVWGVGKDDIFKAWAKSLTYYYWAIFSLVFFVLFVDFGFYSYFKDHINILIFGFIEDDTLALVKTIAQNKKFIPAMLILAAIFFVLFVFSRRASKAVEKTLELPVKKFGPAAQIIFAAVLLATVGFSARGSLKMFPLNPIDAEISSNEFINKLSLNGVITLRKTLKYGLEKQNEADLVKRLGYENNIKKAFSDYLGKGDIDESRLVSYLEKKTPKNPAAERIRPNVVLIVMESFGENLLRYQRDDFDVLGELKKHFDTDYVFYNFLPAGLITIHALESITLNIPQRPFSSAITQSRYAYLDYPTNAMRPFKKSGYETVFVYGGGLNWRELSTFYPAQGFDRLVGEGAMQKDAEKNEWGVYDEYFFDALYNELAKDGRPQFILGMTTGNHPPYSVPKNYVPNPLNLNEDFRKVMTMDENIVRKRLITYQYANQKLGEFITRVKNSPFGKNTIIAVTGDHNFWDIFGYKSDEMFYKYAVPFYLYVPDGLKPKKVNTEVFGSHVDIIPTLYSLALSNASYVSLGKDLLNEKEKHIAFNIDGFIAEKDGAIKYDFKTGRANFYSYKGKKDLTLVGGRPDTEKEKALEYYKAINAVTDHIVRMTGKKQPKNQ